MVWGTEVRAPPEGHIHQPPARALGRGEGEPAWESRAGRGGSPERALESCPLSHGSSGPKVHL